MKICYKCKTEQPLSNFNKDSRNKKDGLRRYCKVCVSKIYKKWRLNNKDYIKEYKKQWDINNKEHRNKYNKEWRTDNKEHVTEYTVKYYQENKEHKNKSKREYVKKRNKTDPLFKLKNNIRTLAKTSFRRKGFKKNSKTEKILGCSFEELKVHLENNFTEGMNWDNRNKWHIDHIVPLASAKTEEDIIRLNHYTNLQPLWAEENLKKSSKIQT